MAHDYTLRFYYRVNAALSICGCALSLMMLAIITNIIQEIDFSKQQEREAQAFQQIGSASQISDSDLHSDLTDNDARLERKFHQSNVKDFVEELGSQQWHLATRLSDQLIKELKQHFESSSHSSLNPDDSSSSEEQEDTGSRGDETEM